MIFTPCPLLNLGGSIEMIATAVRIAEFAIDKQVRTSSCRSPPAGNPMTCPTIFGPKISIEFHKDAPGAVFKALVE